MTDPRQGDIFLFPILEGTGDIKIQNGEPIMDQGFETAVYISLEGGTGKVKDYFGNQYLDEDQQIVSKSADFREGAPLTSNSILTHDELAAQDLEWMKNVGIADDVDVETSIIGKNRIEVAVDILKDGDKVALSPFQLNWKAQRDNPANERG